MQKNIKCVIPFCSSVKIVIDSCCHNPRCPPSHMVKENATGKFCVYTLCASQPCHRGTCVAQTPLHFTCRCPEGYRGQHCEVALAAYHDDLGLSFSSLFAICICFMALLGNYICSMPNFHMCHNFTQVSP